jgi:ubiquinone biosynthesis protein
MGRQLYPQLDLWTTAKPYMERWMSEQVGLRAFLRSAERHLPKILVQLPELPVRLQEALDAERHRAQRDAALRAEVRDLRSMLQRDARRRLESLVGFGLLLGAGILTQMDGVPQWFGLAWPAWPAGLIGLGLLLFSLRRGDGVLKGMRSVPRRRLD